MNSARPNVTYRTDAGAREAGPSVAAPQVPYDRVKRGLDVLCSGLALLVLSPIIVGVGAAVALAMGRPVLFRQTRPGFDGRLFELRKFRTMHPVGPDRVSDDDRLSRLGRWLRATSLDELPTLWNVLRGDMSLVGPRPLLVSYLERYTPEQARRHEVRPGITGLAQVRGRVALSFEERFINDVQYVDTRCLRLDLRILLETVLVVLRREGVTADGYATGPEFLGTAGSVSPTKADPGGAPRREHTVQPGRHDGPRRSTGLGPPLP